MVCGVLILDINCTTTMTALPKRRRTGFHGPRHGRARVQPVPKRAEEVFFRVKELLKVHKKEEK